MFVVYIGYFNMPNGTAAAQLIRGMTRIAVETGYNVVIIDIGTDDCKTVKEYQTKLDDAAKEICKKHRNVEFHVCGFCEPEYDGRLQSEVDSGNVIYHGTIRNVAEFMGQMNCIIHPTYYPEGMSNVLLEACATGRPIITTDRSGCREVVEDGVNGYVIRQQDSMDLIEKVELFLSLSPEDRKNMGIAGRNKVEKEFDRQIVIDRYLEEIAQLK